MNQPTISGKDRDYVHQIPEIASLLEGADSIDIKSITGEVSLREFVAGLLSYQPGWMTFLYRIRWGFVRLLGMKQEGVPQAPPMHPEDVPMNPGQNAHFFAVKAAEDGRYWLAEAVDTHLTAQLGVVVEPLENNARRFYVVTIVHYNSWAGPVYFNVIRPFHHLVVAALMKAAVGN